MIDTVFFERVPGGMRGRVLGVAHASAWIAMPLGVLVAGAIIQGVGLRATLLATGAAYLAITVAARFSPALRGLDPVTLPASEATQPSGPRHPEAAVAVAEGGVWAEPRQPT